MKAVRGAADNDGMRETPTTTAEYFARALRKCEGNYVPLAYIVRIMAYLGWTTKSSTRAHILRNVHSRLYKHRRHVEDHPETAWASTSP